MSDAHVCDLCGKMILGDYVPFGWIALESIGFHGDAIKTWHFCSWSCVSRWSVRQR